MFAATEWRENIHTLYPFTPPPSISFSISLARPLAPSLDTHHLVFVVRKHIHTEQPASTNFTQNTRNYLFRHSNNPQSCNIQIERENRRGVEKKRVRKAINNGTKWIFMCCLLFKYTFSVLSVVASNVWCVYGRVMFSQRKTSRVRSEVWIQKKTSVIIIYAYIRNFILFQAHSAFPQIVLSAARECLCECV